MLDAILEFANTGKIPTVFTEEENRVKNKKNFITFGASDLPKRMEGSNLNRHSKVIEAPGSDKHYRPLPLCPIMKMAYSEPSNETAPV